MASNWQHDRRSTTERGYGWQWQKLRARIMARDMHLCQPCLREGRTTPAREVDHIKPKAEGGTDDPSNLEAICVECHDHKSKAERARINGQHSKPTIGVSGWPDQPLIRREVFGYSIPHGLKHSAIPVIILSGPPAAGKSTYIRDNAGPDDLVIDFDVYLDRIGAVKWTKDKAQVKQAFRMRDQDLRSLAHRTTGRAWLIATAPTRKERDAWLRALGPKASVKVLSVPAHECIARIKADAGRKHAIRDMIANVKAWHRAHRQGG